MDKRRIGRKPLTAAERKPESERKRMYDICLTPAQHARLVEIGGGVPSRAVHMMLAAWDADGK